LFRVIDIAAIRWSLRFGQSTSMHSAVSLEE
jgi:hypothetical protein